ncbi:hypothetical protein V1264_020263 [Littorina saxatilis]|uniref:DUF4817 domain-containing protein n=1 Tax=Littorina saxatilis TaxID=31220 RepID=A0AAN9BEJ5_9CAEN
MNYTNDQRTFCIETYFRTKSYRDVQVQFQRHFGQRDFYLWGFLKDNVYRNNPQTITELKRAITTTIRGISQQECVRVIDNFARRVQVCMQRRGGHLEHVL